MAVLLAISLVFCDKPPSWMDPTKLPQVEIYWDFSLTQPREDNELQTVVTLVVDTGKEKRYGIGRYPGKGWDMRQGSWEPPEGALLGALFMYEGKGQEITVWRPKSQKKRVLIVRYRERNDLGEKDYKPD